MGCACSGSDLHRLDRCCARNLPGQVCSGDQATCSTDGRCTPRRVAKGSVGPTQDGVSGAASAMKRGLHKVAALLSLVLLPVLSLASETEGAPRVELWMATPFVLLLLAIALMPFIAKHW